MIIALLHPGAMGATVGAALRRAGYEVRWLAAGRSDATRLRAEQAALAPCASLRALLDGADAVLSVCPPDRASDVARQVRAAGFAGIYVDANAVAPATARDLEAALAPAAFVDGGIVGPPARQPGTTRLYLSGAQAGEVAGWFHGSPLDAVALAAPAGAASALKMCYAAWTKGTAALLLAVHAAAEAEQVAPALLQEWALSQPDLPRRAERAAAGSAGKAWRFVGEMQEIAATFEAVGLPGGFHRAAAEVYQRLQDLKDQDEAGLDEVLRALSVPDRSAGGVP